MIGTQINYVGMFNWRVHLARIKYHELVGLYKRNQKYEKFKAQRYYNLSKPFGKIAYRDKKQYFIAINELKSILKKHPNFGDVYYGLALSYGLVGQHKNEVFCFKKALDLNPNLIGLLPTKQRKLLIDHEIISE